MIGWPRPGLPPFCKLVQEMDDELQAYGRRKACKRSHGDIGAGNPAAARSGSGEIAEFSGAFGLLGRFPIARDRPANDRRQPGMEVFAPYWPSSRS